jgi:hypothetical protein
MGLFQMLQRNNNASLTDCAILSIGEANDCGSREVHGSQKSGMARRLYVCTVHSRPTRTV